MYEKFYELDAGRIPVDSGDSRADYVFWVRRAYERPKFGYW